MMEFGKSTVRHCIICDKDVLLFLMQVSFIGLDISNEMFLDFKEPNWSKFALNYRYMTLGQEIIRMKESSQA